jgi:hypothetical protein
VGVAILSSISADRLVARVSASPFRVLGTGLAAAVLCVTTVGNVAVGENVYYRFPGPYVFGTDARSLTPELRSVMAWLSDHAAPGETVISDRSTSQAVAGFTQLDVPLPSSGHLYALYSLGGHPSPELRADLREAEVDYFVLDVRIETELPVTAYPEYFPGYDGPSAVSVPALRELNNNPFSELLLATEHYRVYRLHP